MPAGQGTSNRVKIDNLDELASIPLTVALAGGSDAGVGRSKIWDGTDVANVSATGELQVGGVGFASHDADDISVADTATVIVAARAARGAVVIVNEGTTAVKIGNSDVTATANGILLPGVLGASITIPTTAAVYGIVAAGTQTVSYLEVF